MRTRALVVALVALLAAPVATADAQTGRQRQIEERIRELRAAIGEASADEAELLSALSDSQGRLDDFDGTIARIDGELAAANGRLQGAEADVQRLEGRYVALTARLRETNRAMNDARDEVAGVAAEMYRRAGGGRAVALGTLALEAGTPEDLFAGTQYLTIAAEADQDRIDDLARLRERVQLVREGLEDEREQARAARDVVAAEQARIAGLRNEQARARGQVAGEVDHQEGLLAQVHTQKDRFTAEINALRAESNSVASMLRARQSGQQLVASGSGILAWPVAAALTSGFGSRVHPILGVSRMHNGVDFGAPPGAPVRAAGDGDVLWAGPRGGYGNAVIIDHGNALATLYAHLSSVSVPPGGRVSRGQVVGAVGSTGLSTGPHLHFEVRQAGVPVNPLAYL